MAYRRRADAGPVLRDGEQEVGDDRHGEAEQHFMTMPDKRSHLADFEIAEQHQQPGRTAGIRVRMALARRAAEAAFDP